MLAPIPVGRRSGQVGAHRMGIQGPVAAPAQFHPLAQQTFQVPAYNLPQWDLRNLQYVIDAIHAARQALSVGDLPSVVQFLSVLTQRAPFWFGIGLRPAQMVPTDAGNLNRMLLGIETNLNMARRAGASGIGWSALNQAVIWANDTAQSIIQNTR